VPTTATPPGAGTTATGPAWRTSRGITRPDTTPTVENEISVDEPLDAARFSCVDWSAGVDNPAWITQLVDPTKVATLSVDGVINDFDLEEPPSYADNIEARLWFNDEPTGAPDAAMLGDEDGKVSFDAPSCQPLAYLTYPDPAQNKARPTYKSHQVYGYTDSTFDAEYISVSNDTYNVIPAILGVPVEAGKSLIAGTAFDCSREPDTLSEIDAGKIEGAQVIVRNIDGTKPEGVQVRYFVENFPDRDQTGTSADGLWAAVNVPPGDIRVELWGLVDGTPSLLGVTEFTTYADSINIANIFAGYDSVKYPAACLLPVP